MWRIVRILHCPAVPDQQDFFQGELWERSVIMRAVVEVVDIMAEVAVAVVAVVDGEAT